MTEAQKAWLDANPQFEIGGRGHQIRGYLPADGSIGALSPSACACLARRIRAIRRTSSRLPSIDQCTAGERGEHGPAA
jgi:hypothetical protein